MLVVELTPDDRHRLRAPGVRRDARGGRTARRRAGERATARTDDQRGGRAHRPLLRGLPSSGSATWDSDATAIATARRSSRARPALGELREHGRRDLPPGRGRPPRPSRPVRDSPHSEGRAFLDVDDTDASLVLHVIEELFQHLGHAELAADALAAVTVYLVGAGPGDPGLLTVRADQVLRRADVVVYDRLSVEALLDLAPAGAERISVGKAPGQVTMAQDEINALLVDLAARHATVVRLKGGDPFVFARGGEEAAALGRRPASRSRSSPASRRPSPCPPTPASRSRCATRRRRSRSSPATRTRRPVTTAASTGAPSRGSAARSSSSWASPASVGSPTSSWPAGLPPDTPVAAVRWGTRPEQTTVRATLATIADQPLATPSVIVVGRGGRRRPGVVRAPTAVRSARRGHPHAPAGVRSSSVGPARGRRGGRSRSR